ncbi:DUF3617 domain-containing protein [Sphingomicrobium aestuariivivum]|uniref:DUF3617 domain-containing protein n=1 Tax=Sphingomicrobium aestuariivivum TaxID=1582356 RepID=UPI001FD644CE|nr:DUF3617 family protein [Sphingomicrobium aestuariivivum]MCJ8190217.1 hypothetical protein [Sphingomicrobium aestuariivivum]
MIGLTALGFGLGGTAALGMEHQGKPHLLKSVESGLWEVTKPGSKAAPKRICLADVSLLAQFEHMGRQCTRMTVSEKGDTALMRYTCTSGGFGSSDMQVVTPRSLRIQTQGIKDGLPFHDTLHARRVGSC